MGQKVPQGEGEMRMTQRLVGLVAGLFFLTSSILPVPGWAKTQLTTETEVNGLVPAKAVAAKAAAPQPVAPLSFMDSLAPPSPLSPPSAESDDSAVRPRGKTSESGNSSIVAARVDPSDRNVLPVIRVQSGFRNFSRDFRITTRTATTITELDGTKRTTFSDQNVTVTKYQIFELRTETATIRLVSLIDSTGEMAVTLRLPDFAKAPTPGNFRADGTPNGSIDDAHIRIVSLNKQGGPALIFGYTKDPNNQDTRNGVLSIYAGTELLARTGNDVENISDPLLMPNNSAPPLNPIPPYINPSNSQTNPAPSTTLPIIPATLPRGRESASAEAAKSPLETVAVSVSNAPESEPVSAGIPESPSEPAGARSSTEISSEQIAAISSGVTSALNNLVSTADAVTPTAIANAVVSALTGIPALNGASMIDALIGAAAEALMTTTTNPATPVNTVPVINSALAIVDAPPMLQQAELPIIAAPLNPNLLLPWEDSKEMTADNFWSYNASVSVFGKNLAMIWDLGLVKNNDPTKGRVAFEILRRTSGGFALRLIASQLKDPMGDPDDPKNIEYFTTAIWLGKPNAGGNSTAAHYVRKENNPLTGQMDTIELPNQFYSTNGKDSVMLTLGSFGTVADIEIKWTTGTFPYPEYLVFHMSNGRQIKVKLKFGVKYQYLA